MTQIVVLSLGAALAIVILYFVGMAIRGRLAYRGKMLVTCPETKEAVGVKVSSKSATLSKVAGKRDLRLSECTRWPERQDCGQECLRQIENRPEACMVQNVLAAWYEGKECAYCAKPFENIQWHDHKPALMSPEGKLVEWREVPVETLPEVFESHRPVCWNCLVAETFRLQHPELVTEMPERRAEQS